MIKNFKAVALALVAFIIASAPALAVRTNITAKTPPSLLTAVTANSADFTFTAADTVNFNSTDLTGKELLLIQNSDPTNPYTATVTSAPDELGRTGDITAYSLAAGEFAVLPPFPVNGWRQADGKLYFQGSNAAIKFAVIKLRP